MAFRNIEELKSIHPRVVVGSSSAYIHLFTKMRDSKTSSAEFMKYSKRAMRLLAEEAIAELPSSSVEGMTPTGTSFQGVSVADDNVCLVSIIRAGDALLEAVRDCLPDAKVGKILIQRNEDSAEKEPILYYSKMPPNMAQKSTNIILCDPMLATGGSAKLAIRTLIEKYHVSPQKIIFANMISCPEGLQAMAESYPEIKIVTACVDPCLNEQKYIVPGLGDYGDRFFNTVD